MKHLSTHHNRSSARLPNCLTCKDLLQSVSCSLRLSTDFLTVEVDSRQDQSYISLDRAPVPKCHQVAKWFNLIRWINKVLIGGGVERWRDHRGQGRDASLFLENRAYMATSYSHARLYIYRLPRQIAVTITHAQQEAFRSLSLSLTDVSAQSCRPPGLCCPSRRCLFWLASLRASFTTGITGTGGTPTSLWWEWNSNGKVTTLWGCECDVWITQVFSGCGWWDGTDVHEGV